MSKNKAKKLARKAAAANPSTSEIPTPKRQKLTPSSQPQSSKPTNDLDISVITVASEGPTLPIVGGGIAIPNPVIPTNEETKTVATIPATEKKKPHDLQHLQTPWLHLPLPLRTTLSKSLGSDLNEKTEVVVISRNSSVKGSISKVQRCISSTRGTDKLIAVAAQGDGITKLVGVLEVVRRVCAPKDGDGEEEWWGWNCLSCREVPRRVKRRVGQGDEGEEEDGFTTLGEIQDEDRRRRPATEPVLVVWLAGRRVEGFEEWFRGERFLVGRSEG